MSQQFQNVSVCIERQRVLRGTPGSRYHARMTKVLIIDDDKKHSELLQAYFKRFGIKLICAYDATEGFKKLSREDPDLLLLDIMLPGNTPRSPHAWT